MERNPSDGGKDNVARREWWGENEATACELCKHL